MSNPLMQMMGGPVAPQNNAAGGLASLGNIARMLRTGNPEQIGRQLMQQNPQFRAFVQANQGKDPMQVAKEHGVDLSAIMKQL